MTYYNEFDPFAAAWLERLIAAGHISGGTVDRRSIKDVKAEEVQGERVHLFAGIGGWDYALQLAGWPATRPVWTGSCPCQPFSAAGKRKGQADNRHLWPDMFRLVRECRPDTIFGEQVASAIGHGWLDGVFADLESEGYTCGAIVLGAHSVGAPHIRQRLWWVADCHDARHAALQRGVASEVHQSRPGVGTFTGPECGFADGRLAHTGHAHRRRPHDERPAGTGAAEREQEATQPGRRGAVGGLADADGGNAGPERKQRGRQQRLQQADGGTGGLEHAESNGREQRRAESGGRGIAGGREHGGMAEPESATGQPDDRAVHGVQEPVRQGGADRLAGVGPRGSIGLGDTHESGPQGRDGAVVRERADERSPWSASTWHPCRDGKARRIPIEPALFPLAPGLPGRVGLLRGAGNAIVPAVAAAFIAAFLESEKELRG